jgi:hypothetical protein
LIAIAQAFVGADGVFVADDFAKRARITVFAHRRIE